MIGTPIAAPEPFRASFLKIERARRHIRELEDVAREFLATDPVKVTTTVVPTGFSFSMNFPPVPEAMSSILGDVFHNLRSALDLMAGEMCRRQNASDDGVYFPFSKDESDLELMIKRRNFNRAGPDAVRLLKEMKPYGGGNVALRAIHDLNVQDKHRALIVNAMAAASPIIDLRPDDGRAWAIVGDPNKPSEVKLVFPPDCPFAGQELLPTLHGLLALTTSVVEAFKGLVVPALVAQVSVT